MEAKELATVVRVAELAAAHARDVRAAHRKHSARGNRERQADIAIALTRLKRAMAPLRSEIAKFPYLLPKVDDQLAQATFEEQRDKLLEASALVQRERRKLWKMQDKKVVKRGKR